MKNFQFSATAAPLFQKNENKIIIYSEREPKITFSFYVNWNIITWAARCIVWLSPSLSPSLSNAVTLCVGSTSLSKTINQFLSNEMFSKILIYLWNKCDGRLSTFWGSGQLRKTEWKVINWSHGRQAGRWDNFSIFFLFYFQFSGLCSTKIEYINNKHGKHLSQLQILFQKADRAANQW